MENLIQIGSWILVGLIAVLFILVISRILDVVLSGIYRLLGGILMPLLVLVVTTGLGAYIGYQMETGVRISNKNMIIGGFIGLVVGNIIILAFSKTLSPPPDSDR